MKKKEKRGRKPLPAEEKKKRLEAFVKAKNYAKAKKEIQEVIQKYN